MSGICGGFDIPALCRYAGSMRNRFNNHALSIVAASIGMTMSAHSAEKRADPQTLPGVKSNYRIVKPMAPEPDAEPPATIKADGWEVSVSGTITVDIGTGNLPLPRH